MKQLRKLLLPLSLIYWVVTAVRNFLYDRGLFTSYAFPLPVIAVGNLSTGGTGKTPQTEYLIRLLQHRYRIATLSRGYKRKTEGFIQAGADASALTLGDEPYQFYTKFPNVTVAVDANRKNGIEQLLALPQKPEVILLDDAYQHRRVRAGLYILLTAYGDLYADDYILPAGNLRESRAGAGRARIIIVTKCPPGLSGEKQQAIIKKLKPQEGQQVYFSYVAYDDNVYSAAGHLAVADIKQQQKILVAGIAKPEPFFAYLQGSNDSCMAYPDHHEFTGKEIEELNNLAQTNIIITTEKDYVRLQGKLPADRLYYLPIKSSFLSNAGNFDKTILDYVGQSTGNR